MRKIFVMLLVFTAILFSREISVHQGWNLLGATSQLNPSNIKFAKNIWVYRDNNWTLYYKDAPAGNYGFSKLNSIQVGEGFWINANQNDTLNFPSSKTYHAYGLYLQDKKSDDRYTISNNFGTNSVVFNKNNTSFVLSAYKNPYKDSRAELRVINLWAYPITSAEARVTLKLEGSDATGWRDRAQLNLCSLPITQSKDASGCTGIVLGTNGAYVWYEKDYFDGRWNSIKGIQFGTENMVGKDITMKISLNGSKITYLLSGDVNHEVTIDTAETNATTTGVAGSLGIRARADGRDVNISDMADATYVTVKNISVIYK